MAQYQLTRDDLLDHLKDEMAFMERSAAAFDDGHEGEAKRLATVIRVLLHDTKNSHSVLGQLGVREQIDYVERAEPINPRNLLPTIGLAMMRVATGPRGGGAYVPPLDALSPPRQRPNTSFEQWWGDAVTKDPDGNLYSRRDYVLTVSNKQGGAHVDPSLDSDYVKLTKQTGIGWMYASGTGEVKPIEGDLALASVRQIAYEMDQTLKQHARQLGLL